MRIAWIEHALSKIERYPRREHGLEFIFASSLEEFERKYGSIESYDGLLIHPGFENQAEYIARMVELKIPAAIVTCSPSDYNLPGEIPVLSYNNEESIVEFFKQRQVANKTD